MMRRLKVDSLNPREYRGTSLIRKCFPLGPYSRTVPRALWWSYGGGPAEAREGGEFRTGLDNYRGTWLMRNAPFLGPYSRTILDPMVVLGGGGGFL